VPVSAVDCVQPALQHTRAQLFTRFRFGQWSRLALVGILAAELHVGGCNFNGLNLPFNHPRHPGREMLPSSSLLSGLPGFNSAHISEHIAQFLALFVVGAFVAIVAGFVFLYLNSVFRFILFDSVLRRECSIGGGWQRWRRAGGRFFLWQIVFQFASWLVLGVLIGVPLVMALAAGWATDLKAHVGRIIVAAIFFFGVLFVFVLAAVVIQALAKDFLVPIMALEDLDFAEGWHRVMTMVRLETGRFVVYLLLKLVLSIAATILFSIVAIIPALLVVAPGVVAVLAGKAAGMGWNVVTISLAIIFGSVLLLLLIYLIALVCVPGTVFFPAYALYFLASRYPILDALLNPTPVPPVAELPPTAAEFPPPVEPPPLPPSAEPI
jgi:hypothetical protein